MYAVKADAPALITSLAAQGANVCLLAASGKSTLMLACELGLPDCVRTVLSVASSQLEPSALRAFVNLEFRLNNWLQGDSAHDGCTAIFFCLGSDSDANAEMVKMLLEAGADISHVDDKGNTLCDIAAMRGLKLASVLTQAS